MKSAIIGLGAISDIHRIGIEECDLTELVAVCDIDPSTHANYSDLPFYTDYLEMIHKEAIDVVHVCLPHDLHVPVAIDCLKAGVHVFTEKPVGVSYKDALRLQEATKKSDKKCGVCFQNRYNRTTRVLLEHLEAEGGQEVIKAVKGLVVWARPETYYTVKPWRGQMSHAGGGTIINQAIHTLDLMQYFAGPVQTSKSQLFNLLDYGIDVEDTAVALFEFPQGRTGFYTSTNAYYDNSPVEIEVITKNGRYVIRDYKLYHYDTEDRITELCEDDRLEGMKSYYGYGHKLCIQAFYEAILNHTNEFVSVTNALESMLMVDMMKVSSETNQKVSREEIIND